MPQDVPSAQAHHPIPTVITEASVVVSKRCLKSGTANTGADAKSCLSSSNATYWSYSYTNSYKPDKFDMGTAIFAKLVIN